MRGDQELDDQLLKQMADEADGYIRSFAWSIDIHAKYFGDGWGHHCPLSFCPFLKQAT